MTYVNSKYSQTATAEDPFNDPNSDFYDGLSTDSAGDGGLDVSTDGAAGPTAPTSTSDMRSWLNDLLRNNQISTGDYSKYMGEVNHSVIYSEDKRAQLFSEIYGEVSNKLSNAAGGNGDNFSGSPDVTSKQISDLMNEIKSGQVKPTKGSLSTDQCLAILTQALHDEGAKNDAQSAAEYSQVLEAVGGSDAVDPKNLAAQKLGETPTSVDSGGTFHFDGHSQDGSESLNLKSPGDGSQVVVDNATNVTLTPKNSSDDVKLSEEGNYYVIQMGGDTFKVNKDAKLRIYSDHVSGSVDNSKHSITVGVDDKTQQSYTDPAQAADVANKVQSGADGVADGGKYNVNGGDKKAFAKQILNDMAAALRETDPQKRKNLWATAADELSQAESKWGGQPEHLDDVAQTVFNALYGELGDSGLKNALAQGLIPADFASKLATDIACKADDNLNDDAKNNSGGYVNMNHQQSADFLKNNLPPA